jgi:hypothetical protein
MPKKTKPRILKLDALFNKCVRICHHKSGVITISCKLGKWRVSGRDEQQVRKEAGRYWVQYLYDGEYNDMLVCKSKHNGQ